MNWLQNLSVILVGFLLARILIEENVHYTLVNRLVEKGGSGRYFITSLLYASYALSLFFPNTVVIIAMIPVVKLILNRIKDPVTRDIIATKLVLALIYGANIGGMGSMIGASSNIYFLGFIEINKIPGRENITFFSWILFGIPLTFILLMISRLVLLKGIEKAVPRLALNSGGNRSLERIRPGSFKNYKLFFFGNILFMMGLTGIQFLFKPGRIHGDLNIVDLIFIIYLGFFVFIAFIYPKGKKSTRQILKNVSFLGIFILLAPFIFMINFWQEFKTRFKFDNQENKLEEMVGKWFNQVWFFCYRERIKDIRTPNKSAYVSLNRLVFDLPAFGLIFMGLVIVLVFIVLKIGDNPLTPELDGYVFNFIRGLVSSIIQHYSNIFIIMLIVIFLTVFFTEIISNTTMIIIMFSLVISLQAVMTDPTGLAISPLYFLLGITIGSTAAFMSPIASPVNAIAYASIRNVSLKEMCARGLVLNILCSLWIAFVFYLLLIL